MRILVVGAGATGGFFGGRLTQAGRDVTFLVHAAHLERLRERGLKIISPDDAETVTPNLVTVDTLDSVSPADVVLLAVKGPALESALDDVAPAVGESTTIIPFLNGMRHLDILNERFGADRVLGGVARIFGTTDADGAIVQEQPGASIEIGEQDGDNGERVTAVAEQLSVPGYDLRVGDDILSAMWHKWVFLASLAAVTTLMRGTTGDVASVTAGADLEIAVIGEAAAISAAAGYPLAPRAREKLDRMFSDPASGLTASLYRDLKVGRPVEVEPVIGDLVARAGRLDVPAPLLTAALVGLRVYEHRRQSGTLG